MHFRNRKEEWHFENGQSRSDNMRSLKKLVRRFPCPAASISNGHQTDYTIVPAVIVPSAGSITNYHRPEKRSFCRWSQLRQQDLCLYNDVFFIDIISQGAL